MIPSSSDLSTRLIYYLAEPAFRSLALAALAGAALAIARAKDATMRLAVWTAVLYASLAMPFLARVAPRSCSAGPAFLAARSASAFRAENNGRRGHRLTSEGCRCGKAIHPQPCEGRIWAATRAAPATGRAGDLLAVRRSRAISLGRRFLAGAARGGLVFQPAAETRQQPHSRRTRARDSCSNSRGAGGLEPRPGLRNRQPLQYP